MSFSWSLILDDEAPSKDDKDYYYKENNRNKSNDEPRNLSFWYLCNIDSIRWCGCQGVSFIILHSEAEGVGSINKVWGRGKDEGFMIHGGELIKDVIIFECCNSEDGFLKKRDRDCWSGDV